MQENGFPSFQENLGSPITRRIEDWKSRLIDLSKRNNLLYFKPSKRRSLSVSNPNMETIFNHLALRKRRFEFWDYPEDIQLLKRKSQSIEFSVINRKSSPTSKQLVCGGTSRSELEKTLKNLHKRSLLDYRERGVRILYATFGMLVWKEKETGEEVHSPLILVPIELDRKSFRDPFTISVPPIEEEFVLNPALQVKLKKDFTVELPPLPEYWESQSLLNYFSVITQVADELGWSVENTVEIGLFSFHKLVIYNDLDTNAILITEHPIIRKIAGVRDEQIEKVSLPEEKDLDSIQPPEKTFQVLDADSSQRVSIEYALRGQSFVMQGPPGTGKSQTIANIIAECIAHGKSVLFVSDKMAALEVVYKRLHEVGLSSFCLELHSSKANKREVVAELKRCLDEQLVPRKLPLPHDFEKMTLLRSNLNNYVISLHQKRLNLGKSAYDVLGELSTLECIPFVAVEVPNVGGLTPQRMLELETLMSRLKSIWQAMEDPDFAWRGYKGNEYNLEVRAEVSTVLDGLILTIEAFKTEAGKFSDEAGLSAPSTFERAELLIEIGNLLLESPKPEASWVIHPNIDKLISEAETHLAMFEWCKATRNRLLDRYNPAFFGLAFTMSSELESSLSAIGKLLLHSSLEESEILEKRARLLGFARLTQCLYAKWSEKSWQLAQMLGLKTANLTPDRIRQLSHIALLCFSDNKPELGWFNPDVFQRIKEELPEIKKDYQEYKALKLKLEKTYTREFFKRDLDELIDRYNSRYTNSLKWFRSSFYRDQKQIALLTHDGKAPKSVIQDLIDARKLKRLSNELEASESVKALLGHFYEGYSTDFERIEKAIETTSELFRQSDTTRIPEELAQMASYGSDPPIVIRQIGNELEESFEKWNQLVKELSDFLPTSRLPNSNLPLYETPIAILDDWATAVEKQLIVLCEITKETLKTSRGKAPQNYKHLIDDLKDAEQVRKKEAAFLIEHEGFQTKFGSRFKDLETNWEEILSVLHWTKKLQTLCGTQKVHEAFANVVSRGAEHAPSNSDLISLYEATVKALVAFEARFEIEPKDQRQKLQTLKTDALQRRIKWLREHVDDLESWIDFKETKRTFSLNGLSAFFDRLTENPPPAAQLLEIFRKAVYQEWLNHLYEEDQTLGQFRREKHEHVIAEFVKLDKELIRLSPNRVIEAANSRKPRDILIQANDSEATTLIKESLKKRRLMPIRTLFQRIPHLLSRLKPCLLMSPMSVSQFLPSELMKYDLILFDEASQIVPEDAIGTIYRGKAIVVAGDNKQLPPTSFFQKSLFEDIDWDEINDEDFEVFDSILDECAGVGLPVKMLRWHYRSRHEELIAFSNNNFYEGNLITFPSAIAKDNGLGVKMVHVPGGVYDRGGKRDNLKEAEVVADLVFEHFQKHPKKTIGVVTFSIAQMDAVEGAVERRRMQQPGYEHLFKEDRLEGFFVKNLENVQGDERDVIILSLGYGFDPQGQMTMNFGPVNRAGGERRLNVAVTRAREMTILVSSIKAADMDMESAKSMGTILLHAYLEYAERGPEMLNSVTRGASEFESPIEEDVAMVLQRLGYAFVPHVGCSSCSIDIGVIDPNNSGGYLLGVEFDGTTYQNSSSARDRDRLRAQVLRLLGWRIHRVWSPTWVARRDSEIRRLSHALDQARKFQLGKEATNKEGDLEKVDADNEMQQEVDSQKMQFGGTEKIGAPYKVYALKAKCAETVKVSSDKGYSGQPKELHFEENRQLQTRLLEELIQNEGPIHFDYSVERLVSAWGLKRKNAEIVHAVREALYSLIESNKVIERGNFLWPPELQDIPVRVPVRGIPESKRKPAYIPPEEIENAMRAIAKYALGISSESLIAETAKVFGFSRPGEKTKKRFSDIYKRLLWEKQLICDNDLVTVA